jgi:uroporphyrin-III C-methyltransferase
VIRQGTTQQQATVTGTLAEIVERSIAIEAPALIVVGDVVRLKSTLDWFLPYSLNDAAPANTHRPTVSSDSLTA